MSLKAFHVLFIIVSILLAVGCAAWSWVNGTSPAFGYGSAAAAVALVCYGVWFVKKSRRIIV